jgi:hypothetical protein
MFTGSFASSYHGAPRATQDIDVVIAPTAEQLAFLEHVLSESGWYVDLNDALEALTRERQFNAIDMTSGWKVGFIIRKSRPFSLEEFGRRFQIEFEGLSIFMVSAEDIILAKLEWAKLGLSERQIEDVASILRIRWGDLDFHYIESWVENLDIKSQWTEAVQSAFPSGGTF